MSADQTSAVAVGEATAALRVFETTYDPSSWMYDDRFPADDRAKAIRRRLPAMQAALAAVAPLWRPWSEAPRDGREVLAYVQQRQRGGVVVVHYNPDPSQQNWWRRAGADEFALLHIEPTHWQPLPGAPVPL